MPAPSQLGMVYRFVNEKGHKCPNFYFSAGRMGQEALTEEVKETNSATMNALHHLHHENSSEGVV